MKKTELELNRQCVEVLWRTILGELTDLESLHQSISGLYDQDSSQLLSLLMSNRLETVGLYDKERLKVFKVKWSSRFCDPEPLSLREVSDFGVELRNTSLHVDNLFGGHNLAGVSICSEGKSTDSNIYRQPGEMRGWNLTFTTQGKGDYNCSDDRFDTGEGDIVLHSPDALCDYQRHANVPVWCHHWLYFQQDIRFTRWLGWREIGPNIYHVKVPDQHIKNLIAVFTKAMSFSGKSGIENAALLENSIEEILIHCSGYHSLDQPVITDQRIDAAKAYIKNNLGGSFSVADVAEAVGLSKARLSKLFKERMKSSVMQWRDQLRVSKASKLLKETDLKISDIAFQVGFSDPLYFSKCFKKITRANPRTFRENHKSLQK